MVEDVDVGMLDVECLEERWPDGGEVEVGADFRLGMMGGLS